MRQRCSCRGTFLRASRMISSSHLCFVAWFWREREGGGGRGWRGEVLLKDKVSFFLSFLFLVPISLDRARR